MDVQEDKDKKKIKEMIKKRKMKGMMNMVTRKMTGTWRRYTYHKEEEEVIEEVTVEAKQEDMKRKNMATDQEEEDIIEMKGTEEKKEQKKTKDGLKPQGAEVLDLEAEEDEEEQEDKEEDEDTTGRKNT